ncbi:MAG TPA: hypothetical protein VFM93_04895 [Candidatus Limnocylindria bacterium]|nr:hypothetical protein [Candidatus Limnocylindria bacterium]
MAGPALFLAYLWSEAVLGPSQPNGGPLRMALGFTLVTGGLLCFAFALLRLHAQPPIGASHATRVGALLGLLSLVLLTLGSALWWPILFVWPELGPLAGAPVGVGTLSLFGAWALLGSEAAQKRSLPSWLRPLPLALLGLFSLLLFVTALTAPWPLVAAVFATFATGWILLACGIWGLATATSRRRAPDALA